MEGCAVKEWKEIRKKIYWMSKKDEKRRMKWNSETGGYGRGRKGTQKNDGKKENAGKNMLWKINERIGSKMI